MVEPVTSNPNTQEQTVTLPAGRCPKTGRSASTCDSVDHRNCPDLRPAEVLARRFDELEGTSR